MVNVRIFSAFCVGALSDDVADEAVKTIFEVGKRQVVETREGLMSPQEFYEQYANLDAGKPILLKGAAKSMPAFKMWSDAAFLVEKFGQQLVGVEELASPAAEAKNKRRGVQVLKTMTVKEFTDDFTTKQWYAADALPRAMAQHVFLPPMLNCGGFQSALASATLWWSSFPTKSRVHADNFENVNCQFSGRKRWALWHKKDLKNISTKDMGWVKRSSASGAFSSAANLNVSNVNLTAFPGWDKLEWYDAMVEPGDCLFVPEDWAQTVWSDGEGPFISANVLFASPTSFDSMSCYRLQERGFQESDFLSTLRDCNYVGTDVHSKLSHCVKRGRMPTGEESDERFYSVTGFCDSRKDILPEHDMSTKKYVSQLDTFVKPPKQEL